MSEMTDYKNTSHNHKQNGKNHITAETKWVILNATLNKKGSGHFLVLGSGCVVLCKLFYKH